MEAKRISVRLPSPVLAAAERASSKSGVGLSVWIRSLVESAVNVAAVDGRTSRFHAPTSPYNGRKGPTKKRD